MDGGVIFRQYLPRLSVKEGHLSNFSGAVFPCANLGLTSVNHDVELHRLIRPKQTEGEVTNRGWSS